MIGKIIKGKSFQGCLSYVMGKTGAAVIGMNMDGKDPYRTHLVSCSCAISLSGV
jgi:hypothetical protein